MCMEEEKESLQTRLREEIENESFAASVDSISERLCTNERGDGGIEFKIVGDFIPIKPIVSVIEESEFVIDEFGVATDTPEPAIYLFVYAEMFGRESTWSE